MEMEGSIYVLTAVETGEVALAERQVLLSFLEGVLKSWGCLSVVSMKRRGVIRN